MGMSGGAGEGKTHQNGIEVFFYFYRSRLDINSHGEKTWKMCWINIW